MSAMQLTLILGPVLGFALLIGYLTRNDPITTKSIKSIQQRPLNRVIAVLSCISGPLAVLLLINILFGALMLIVSGAIFFFQERLYPNVFWVRGVAARFVGVSYLLIGVSLAIHHVVCLWRFIMYRAPNLAVKALPSVAGTPLKRRPLP